MLSPGQWYKLVPKDLAGNLRFRKRVYEEAASNEVFRKGLLAICAKDLLFFLNVFVWQYNPNAIGEGSLEVGPWITWPLQEDDFLYILESIEIRKDIRLEKSREMGASWMCLLIMLWVFLFFFWKKFLAISRNADAVDLAGESDCLFWKLDFVLEHLPDWMAKDRVVRRKMGFVNPVTHSRITGQASTGKAGVGGRCFAMFVDEFSQIAEDYEVLDRTSDTTSCRIFNYTHVGLDTAAYEISRRVDMRSITMHWTRHPDKAKGLYKYNADTGKVDVIDKQYDYGPDFQFVVDGTPTGGPFPGLRSPWYDSQCKRKGSLRAIAMDLDIDPQGSVSEFFDRLMLLNLTQNYCQPAKWEGDLHYDHDTGKPFALVPRLGGTISIWGHLIGGRPKPDLYGCGADIATGNGATPSCLSICSGTTGEKVMEYRSAVILPERLGALAVAVCWMWKSAAGDGALLAWEVPGPGYIFGQSVTDLGYRHIYFKTPEFDLGAEASEKPGWLSNPNSKRFLLEDYRAALHSRTFLNRSARALAECRAFAYDRRGQIEHGEAENTNDPSGARLNHADMVIADALAWKMAKSFARHIGIRNKDADVPVLSLAWRRKMHERLTAVSDGW